MSQKQYNKCDMKTGLKSSILKRIQSQQLKAFSCYDFTDLANYKTISKCLERMEDIQEIKRIIQGIYYLNRYDEILCLPILPSINDVAHCLARKHGWIICPTGNAALNMLGLSTQVPSKYVYLSSGPYKDYLIYDVPIVFKRTMNRELGNYSYKTLLLIQCIKTIGKDSFKEDEIRLLKKRLTEEEKKEAFCETTLIQTWIRNIIIKICKE